jgi:excisionase family DNA binding protein
MALYYTLEEAASLLGTSTFELRNRIQSKQVHALLIGGTWRLRIADVHGLMKQGNSEVSVQAPELPTVLSEPGDKGLSALKSMPEASLPESVPHDFAPGPVPGAPLPESISHVSAPESMPHASALESVPHDSALESVPEASLLGSVPEASLPESIPHVSALEPVSVAFVPESLAGILIPESPSQPSIETSQGATTNAPAPSGSSAFPSVESLRESLNRVLELARSQGMLVEGTHVESGSGSHLRHHEEQAGNLDENESDDGPDLSGPSRLEELFNLALESDHDEEIEAGESEGVSSTGPSSAQASKLEETKNDPDRASPGAPSPFGSKSAPVTGNRSDAVVLESGSRETTAGAKNTASPLELPKTKGSRIAQGGFFPVECPSCQALGQVPPNRMDQQLKCAECGTKFYLDLITNETIIGEKVTTKVAVPLADKKPVDSKGIAAIDAMTDVPQKSRLRIAVMAVATAGLALGLYYFWPRVGNNPGDRTAEVLQALTHNAPGRVVAIALPSSRRDAEAWFKKVRPKDWPDVLPEVPVDINVLSVKKEARASTSIDFPPTVAIMPGSQPEDHSGGGKGPAARSESGRKPVGPRGLSLLLSWRYQNGQWLFDATESLKKTYPPR